MKYFSSLMLVALLASPAFAQLPVEAARDQQKLLQSSDPALAANKKVVYDFWRVVLVARHMNDTPNYMAENYIQHNPNVPTGRKAFIDYFSQQPPTPVKPTIDNLVTIVAERDMVVLAFRQELKDPKNAGKTYTSTWFDMFRIANGKIVEHWDYGTK